jgi:sugar lactone lactonase YvrE
MKEDPAMLNCEPVEVALDIRADLGEGPVWDDRTNQLVWVDIMAGRVNLFNPGTGANRAIETGTPVGAAALCESGGLLLAVQDGFAKLDPATGAITRFAGFPDASPDVRMNDAKCDPQGRLWAGTMAFDMHPAGGALYRLYPDASVTTILPGVTISNGIDWSLDGQTIYYVDTPTLRVDCFDFDAASGAISNRRPFVEIREPGAYPDGLTIDAQGNLWLALWGGHGVRCYNPQAELIATVDVPASQASSCAFGGADLDTLYITTARTGLSEDDLAKQPLAGSLFRLRPGVKGRPANRFGI